jgi:glutamyl-tRNA reductase
MDVTLLGVNHKRAPLVLRECLSFTAAGLPPALEAMREYVPEGAILSTCHRVELYAATTDAARARTQLQRFWSKHSGVAQWEFEPHLYHLEGNKAVEHLFSVASGLDSAIIGESQILGQVREALRLGLEQRSLGRVLSVLFRQAVTTGKRARTETGIGRSSASISSAAVELARKTFGDLSSSRVLLVGAGKMGELAAQNLLDKGVAGIDVVGRTRERALRLALRCGASAGLSHLEDALHQCDIAITCTSAPHHVITTSMAQRVMRQRGGRPLFLIDIAMPRDVEPAVGEISNVHLYNIDDLESAVATNMKERRAEARKVQPIIAEEVAKFESWRATLGVVPAIIALRERAEAIRQEELARTSAVLGKLSEEDRRRIEALTLAIEKKLLHHPIALLRARAAAGDGHGTLEALRDLFGLDAAAGGASDDGASKKDDAPKVTRASGRTALAGSTPRYMPPSRRTSKGPLPGVR